MTTPIKINPPPHWEFVETLIRQIPDSFLRICLVGGSVRDYLLDDLLKKSYPENIKSKKWDLDIVVEEEGGAARLARALHKNFPEMISQAHELGRGYPIWQVIVWHKDFGELEIQIADTQKEMFPDPQSRQRITHFGLLNEDCERRDFTVNMLYYDFLSREILDPSGTSYVDLKAGILRGHPRVDIRKIFSDDPLRMIRLLRFKNKFSWRVDDSTWEAMKSEFHRVSILSAERVRDEILKICTSSSLAGVFEDLREADTLKFLFPETLPMIGCGQDNVYHSEGDVWVHTMSVMRWAPREEALQLAALLHDWGKPETRAEREDGRVTFLNHEKVSTDKAHEWLKKWKFPSKLSNKVLKLVALHLRGGDVRLWKSSKPARKLLKEAGEDIDDLLRLIEADSSASLDVEGKPRLDHIPVLREQIEKARSLPMAPKNILSGHTIMKAFDIREGVEIKKIKLIAEELFEEALLEGRELDEVALVSAIKHILKK